MTKRDRLFTTTTKTSYQQAAHLNNKYKITSNQ